MTNSFSYFEDKSLINTYKILMFTKSELYKKISLSKQIEKEKIIKPNFEKLIFNDAITISLAYVDKILKVRPYLLSTKSIITELKQTIIGAKVNKVYEPTKTEVVLSLYNNGENYLLNLCANPEFCRIHLTNYSKPNPQNAYNFCMLLRKYLMGGRIINVSNFDLERTVEIQFECYNDLNDLVIRKLFIEIMSRQSNIILTNDKNIIIDTLKHSDLSSRELLPAHEYTFAPINKISFLNLNSFDEFYNIFKKETDSLEKVSLSKFFTNTFIGFSKPFIKENLEIMNVSDSEYSKDDLEKIYNHIKEIISLMGTNKINCKEIGSKDYTLVTNKMLEESKSINQFIDEFYFNKEQNSLFVNSRNNLLKIVSSSLKKTYKKLENINQKLKECDDMDKFRLYGELLTANLYQKKDYSKNIEQAQIIFNCVMFI